MSETGVSLLDPSTGLVDDQDVDIVSIRAVVGEDKNDASKKWPSLTMKMKLDNGKEVQEFYSAGSLDRLRPSPDGVRLLPNADGAKLSDQTNAWKLLSSILNAIRGNEDTKAAEAFMAKLTAAPDRLDHFDGMRVHVNRQQKPKKDDEGPEAKARTITIVSVIKAFPGAAPKSAGKGSTKAAAAKTSAPAASTPAASAPAPATATGSEVTDDVVAGLLLKALQAKGTIPRNKVATEVYNLAKSAGLDWKAAMSKANDENFIKAFADEPKEVDGGVVIVEYDGAELKVAA